VLVAAGFGIWTWRGRTAEPQTEAEATPPTATLAATSSQPPSPLPAIEESTPAPPAPRPDAGRPVREPAPSSAEPQGRYEPPASPPAAETPASPSYSQEERAEPEPPAAAPSEPAPGPPVQEVHRLAGELETESHKLLEVYESFLESKENAGGEITDTDEQLQEDLEALLGAAEKLNKQFQAGFFARLRNRQPGDRLRVQQRFRDLAQRGEKVERLMGEVQPGPEVRQSWQEVRRRWRRIGEIVAGL
jgi:hypothetical protein